MGEGYLFMCFNPGVRVNNFPADRVRGTVVKKRDKQASGAETTPLKQAAQGTLCMTPNPDHLTLPLILSPTPQIKSACHLQIHSHLVRLV